MISNRDTAALRHIRINAHRHTAALASANALRRMLAHLDQGTAVMPRVLVVDDSECFRAYLAELLKRAGYEVHELPDGRCVEAFISVVPFDAVVTDLFMPGADGIETVRTVKRVAPDLPVIGVTGHVPTSHDPCARAMTMFGAEAVLFKPLDAYAFLSILHQAIVARKSRSAFAAATGARVESAGPCRDSR